MKAEHRKELETNVLADKMGHVMQRVKTGRRDDLTTADIPAVPKRLPRTDNEAATSWAYEATPKIEGIVAGAFPWLRQGWAMIDEEDVPLIPEGLEELRSSVLAAPFTTLDPSGGRHLARLLFGDRK